VLTLSGNFAYEVEEQPSETNFQSLDAMNNIISSWKREEKTDATNPKWQYELNYKKEFEDDEDHMLLISALGSFFGKEQNSEFQNESVSGDPNDGQQQTETEFQQADYTFKLDYTKPFLEKYTVEAGAQYVINDVGNDYEVRNLTDGNWVVNENLTNNFEYNQKVLGLYTTAAYEGDVWGFKAGLRVESTDLKTVLTNTDETNKQDYTDFFPSAHATYKFSEKTSLQAGYSSRIYRPRLWDLNPFFNIRNDYNIRTGNPNLQPEYTDSFELTTIFILEKASINTGLYHRYTTDVIEQVSVFEDNVTLSTPINIGTNNTTGFEANVKYSPVQWFTINGDFNFNYFIRDGAYEDQSFDFNGNNWTTKVTGKFKLPADFDFEITGQYQSGYPTVQSEISANAFADIGIRKKLLKGKAVINLGIRDLFESRIRESETFQPDFYLYNYSTRGRFITLGFSYGFGKGEAMTYSGRRR
jgi:outer membrane receptor protein involved in Fe transport